MPHWTEALFLASIAWIVYAYLGYPTLLWLFSRRGRLSGEPGAGFEPSVTILTAAYNEAAVIGQNLRNKLDLDYPAHKLQMIVISDESEDKTEEIVEEIAAAHPGRIRLLRQEPRQGKTAGLNLAVPEATGEILVFADANSIYDRDALRHLVAAFADPAVGYVTGKMVYTNPDGSVTGDGCTTYMRYENQLRAWETVVGSVIGVDGGIDAVRRELYVPMRPDQLPDFALPLNVADQGRRIAYQPRAVLKEPALSSADQEYRMRVRVTLRALWALWDFRRLLNPARGTVFAWQLASHKLVRYLVFLPQITALVTNALLAPGSVVYSGLLGGQVLFYALAALGHALDRQGRSFAPATLAWYFTLLNLACLHAFTRFARGQKQVLWQPRSG